MDWRTPRDSRARVSFRRVDGADRKRRARDLGESGLSFHAPGVAPGENRAVARDAALSSQFTAAQRAVVQRGARVVCGWRFRFDRASGGHRKNPAKVARLRIAPRATGPLWLPHVARDNRALKSARLVDATSASQNGADTGGEGAAATIIESH